MAAKSEKDKLVNFFYHLGKGLWKSVPILGPIIEEVFYVQFEDELKHRVSRLDEDQLHTILDRIPDIDVVEFDCRLSQIPEDIKFYSISIMTNIISKLEESHKDFLDHVRLIETRVEPIPSIIQILDELKQKAGDKNDILMALNEIRSKRDNWIRRISRNQKKLLSNIPASPTSLDSLWSLAKDLIPDCGYKEFRFRLHELEWLGLVKRFWSQCSDSWMYQSAKVGNHMIDSVRETTQ